MNNETMGIIPRANYKFFKDWDRDHYFVGRIDDSTSKQITLIAPENAMDVSDFKRLEFETQGKPREFTICTEQLAEGVYIFKLISIKMDKYKHEYGIAKSVLRIGEVDSLELSNEKSMYYRLTISALAKSALFIEAYRGGDCGDEVNDAINYYTIANEYGSDLSMYAFTKAVLAKKLPLDDAIKMICEPSIYKRMIYAFTMDNAKDKETAKLVYKNIIDLDSYYPLPKTMDAMQRFIYQYGLEHNDVSPKMTDVEEWLFRQDQYFKDNNGDMNLHVTERIEGAREMREIEKERKKAERKAARKAKKGGAS